MCATLFDDVLDEQLASAPPAPRAWNPGPVGAGAAYGFFFASSPARTGLPVMTRHIGVLASFGDVRLSAYVDAVTANSDVRLAHFQADVQRADAPSFPRAVRVLSEQERQAVAAMAELGAPMADGFTFDEVRRAFRTLALAYHPDRHADRSEQEKVQLGQRFTQARDAYQVLAALFARVH